MPKVTDAYDHFFREAEDLCALFPPFRSTAQLPLPNLLRDMAGKKPLPHELIAWQWSKGGGDDALAYAVRRIVGCEDNRNFQRSQRKKEWIAANGEGKAPSWLEHLTKKGRIQRTVLSDDQGDVVEYFVKYFEQERAISAVLLVSLPVSPLSPVHLQLNIISFEEIQKEMPIRTRVSMPMATHAEQAIALLIGFITFYAQIQFVDPIVNMILAAKSPDATGVVKFPNRTYEFNPANPAHDVSLLLGKAARAVGMSGAQLKASVALLRQGVSKTPGKTQSEEEKVTRKVLNYLWVELAREGRATALANNMPQRIQLAIQLRDGTIKQERKTSGRYQALSSNEREAFLSYLCELAKEGETFTGAGAAMQVNLVSNYTRTPRQMRAYKGNARVRLAIALLERDLAITSLWSEKTIEAMGFVQDRTAPGGYVHVLAGIDEMMEANEGDEPDELAEKEDFEVEDGEGADDDELDEEITFFAVDHTVDFDEDKGDKIRKRDKIKDEGDAEDQDEDKLPLLKRRKTVAAAAGDAAVTGGAAFESS